MKTNIIINFQVEGLHCWTEAKNIIPVMSFLSNLHRHIFHIECKKEVFHDNRDVEFIDFKRNVKNYLEEKYFDNDTQCLLFNSMSCEMICKELIDKFDLSYCKVMEDNENGGEIWK